MKLSKSFIGLVTVSTIFVLYAEHKKSTGASMARSGGVNKVRAQFDQACRMDQRSQAAHTARPVHVLYIIQSHSAPPHHLSRPVRLWPSRRFGLSGPRS